MIREVFAQGGPLMVPLAVCSVLLLALVFERTVVLGVRRVRRVRRPRARRAAAAGTRGGGGGRRGGESRSPADSGPRRLRQSRLKFFWDIPPQLGLLGTVLGLVQIFQGDLDAEAFGRGVGVACFTTVYGLTIALVARTSNYLLDGLDTEPRHDPEASAACLPKPAPAPATGLGSTQTPDAPPSPTAKNGAHSP